MQSDPAQHKQVEAFLKAVAHKFMVESDAAVDHTALITAITYKRPLSHPWPRAFDYQTEFFVHTINLTGIVDDIQQFFSGIVQEHVLNIFGGEATAITKIMEPLGYTLAWTNVLMGKQLSVGETQPHIRLALSEEDIAAMNALDPDHLSSTAALSDPHLHDYFAEYGEFVQGKAQMVTLEDSPIVYISDMFVSPQSRRAGLGNRLLYQLHTQAAALGKTEAILIPSQMTRQIGFYEKHGYKPLLPMHLLIPAAVPNA